MQDWLKKTENEIKLRNGSPRTAKIYTRCLKEYLGYLENICGENIDGPFNEEILRSFLLTKHDKGLAAQTINLYMNAVLFFYRNILHQSVKPRIKFAKRPARLPVVLSRDEIHRMLAVIKNIKHRTIVALAYGAGLRVSEVVSLRIFDLHFHESLLKVRHGKGRRDRMTVLPAALNFALKAFCENKPSESYLFESNRGGKLTVRSAQKIFEKSLKKAKINRPATFHSLRHSFATHLMEDGVNMRYVQELLGHRNIRTTQIYTQVTHANIDRVKSPL